ncbi:hypothetical protein [Haloferula sp. BvORR071]|uniref:hypothetical protein n=1 Tax=Haloferula sp. BvORR071 TaxID=1396141 RepID=UPI0005583DB2|nr:hypothetical protein [Haloferula sp. BvORR071]
MSNVVQPGDVPKAEEKRPELPAAFRKHLHLYSTQLAELYLEVPPHSGVRRMSLSQEPLVFVLPVPSCKLRVTNLKTGVILHLKAFYLELGILILTLGIVGSILWSLARDGASAPPAMPQTLERAKSTGPSSGNLPEVWAIGYQ